MFTAWRGESGRGGSARWEGGGEELGGRVGSVRKGGGGLELEGEISLGGGGWPR